MLTNRPDNTTIKLEVLKGLKRAGLDSVTFEYPGFIHIVEPDRTWAFGDANREWGIDLQAPDGETLDSVSLRYPTSDPVDPAVLVAAIMGTLRAFR